MEGLSKAELERELEQLAPFHHAITLPYGLSTFIPHRSRRPIEHTRLHNVIRHAFPALLEACYGSLHGRRVLDVGCNCGGFAVTAARLNADYVLGIDIVQHYIDQAQLIKRALRLPQLEFKRMDVNELNVTNVGMYDVTFCLGILYHLENPIVSMKRMAAVTSDLMLVDTDVLRAPVVEDSAPLWEMRMPPVAGTESLNISTDRWRNGRTTLEWCPNERAVRGLLQFLGFSKVKKLTPDTGTRLESRYCDGSRATFLARR